MEPLFEPAGCPNCVFLGTYKNHDLYFCPQSGRPTVIARYSNEDGDYLSGMVFANSVDELREAKKRAIEKGLI